MLGARSKNDRSTTHRYENWPRIFRHTPLSLAKLATIATVLCLGSRGLAQVQKTSQNQGDRAAIVLPKPKSDTRVDYPRGASGDAEVVLELLIDVDGHVREVKRVLGEEPFASHASRFVKSWVFEPAQRDGKRVAARIRFQINFSEPETQEEPQQALEPVGTRSPLKADDVIVEDNESEQLKSEPAVEVIIRGKRSATSEKKLSRAEVRQLPGAFGDPISCH